MEFKRHLIRYNLGSLRSIFDQFLCCDVNHYYVVSMLLLLFLITFDFQVDFFIYTSLLSSIDFLNHVLIQCIFISLNSWFHWLPVKRVVNLLDKSSEIIMSKLKMDLLDFTQSYKLDAHNSTVLAPLMINSLRIPLFQHLTLFSSLLLNY